MKRFLALAPLLLGYAQAQDPAKKDPVLILVTLEDGSRFRAKPSSEPLEIRTGFGDLKIPIQEVRSLRRSGSEHVVRTSRLTIQGTLAKEEFIFDTDFGKLRIPASEVQSLDPSRGTSLQSDDNTVLFWAFEDAIGEAVTDLAGGRPAKLADAEIQDDPAGFRAFVRKSENSYLQGPLPDEFHFAEGPFTIEVRVKVGQITRGYATILACNEEANCHNRDFWFLAQAGGQLYFDSGNAQRTNFVSQTSTTINLQAWNYLAVVHDPKEGELRYYVNGKKVHTDKRAMAFNTSSGPLFMGPGNAGKAYFSAPERFQFVRVSRGIRTDEEIADWHKTLETEPSFSSIRPTGRGVALRDGGFLKAEFPALAGAKFKTRFGVLELTPQTRGRIEVYPLREREVEGMRQEILRLIDTLGSRSIDEREEAQRKLIKIGGPSIEHLQKAKGSTDPEVQSRADAILRRFQETGVTRRPVADVLFMGRTVLHGWLQADAIEAASRFGTFKTELKHVSVISLSDPEKEPAGPVIRLRSGETVEGDPRESTISLETEFGTLKVPLRDVTMFRYDEEKKHWIVRTDKAVLTGKVSGDQIQLQTQAGPISVPLGEMAEFGK